jgi:hypothetical protein
VHASRGAAHARAISQNGENQMKRKQTVQERFWTYQPSFETPRVEDLPPGYFNGTQQQFEQLSPGMRREIARAAGVQKLRSAS